MIALADVVLSAAGSVDFVLDVVVFKAVFLADAHVAEPADALCVRVAALPVVIIQLTLGGGYLAGHPAVVPLVARFALALEVLGAAHRELPSNWF